MRLTTFTEYCLRVLLYLGTDPARRTTIAEIAAAFGISESHLMKVVHFLGRQGWVATVRGKGGGMSLGALPSSIVVGDVVRQAEKAPLPARCFSEADSACPIAGVCRLRGALDEAVQAFLAVLDRYTLADLVANRDALAPLLFVPASPPAIDRGGLRGLG